MDSGSFLQVFKETFVPWCLDGYNHSMSSRLDLLLTLLDEECFLDQWCAVMSYAANVKHSGVEPGSLEASHVLVLAMLLEKLRDKITKPKVGEHSTNWQGSHLDHLHHELLDSIAVAVACSFPPFGTSDARLMRYVNKESRYENLNM